MLVPGQPRFSIVIPAYNEAAYLDAALRALQQQDFSGSYEIIVVDNNSTDETCEIAARHGVTVVREPARGVCQARQRGTIEARGEIVVSTDADTTQPRDWLSRIDRQFRRSDQIVAVAGPCRYEDASWWAYLYPKMLFGAVHRISALTGHVSYVSATNTAFRRSAFPGYNLTMSQGGDELDLLRRLRPRGRVVWDPDNVVTTSARRLQKGLFYNLFVTFLTFYLLAYLLNRLSSRQILGMAPAFRQKTRTRRRRGRRSGSGVLAEPRRRWSKGALQTANAAILRLGWREGLSWRGVLILAATVTACLAVNSYALAEAVEGALRFWASP
jgi:glycosyltransferase involved in cell wall biosynthesis